MKKSLVALATLAATSAFAQSSVTIDGILDAGYQAINYKGNKVGGIAGNGSSTSQLNFRGTEDLGGGLKANFRVETDWNVVSDMANTGVAASTNATTSASSINGSAGTFGNGEIRVGAAGNFGAVDLGAVNYNTLGTFLANQPFGTAIGSGFRTFYVNDAQGTSQVRAENAVKYTTPTFYGLNATLYASKKQTSAVNTTAATGNTNGLNPQANAFSSALGAYAQIGTREFGLNYANGPVGASFSQIKQDFAGVPTTGSTGAALGTALYTINTLGANYTFGAAKVSGLYQTNKTDTNSVDNKAYTLSGTYTMGNIVLMAQMGTFTNKLASTNSKLWGLGADYNLSKRTAVYLRAESIKDDSTKAVQAAITPASIKGTDTTFARTSIGLRHAF